MGPDPKATIRTLHITESMNINLHKAGGAKPIAGGQMRFTMRTALMAGFGGLVLAAVVVVLMLGLWSARENTVSLTRKLADAVLDDVQSAIEQRLRPVEIAVDFLGRRIEDRQIDLNDPDDLGRALASALAGMP